MASLAIGRRVECSQNRGGTGLMPAVGQPVPCRGALLKVIRQQTRLKAAQRRHCHYRIYIIRIIPISRLN
jgi:hypothetical protein